jgi:hypothetical protein
MQQKDYMLRQMDEAWKLVREAVEDLTEEEFHWQPLPGSIGEDRVWEEMPPQGVSTIAFKLPHLVKGELALLRFTGRAPEREITSKGAQEWITEMERIHRELRQLLVEWPDGDLDREIQAWRRAIPFSLVWTWTVHHDLWHSSQIRTLRALFRGGKRKQES